MFKRLAYAGLASLLVATGPAIAQKRYDPGASDTEIKLGQTMPFSGPVSAAGTVGKASIAFFDALNKGGGINGRKVTVISLDDGYSPPKTVETTRKLVEDDEVLLLYGSVGTPTNAAVQKYLNTKKIPQLFISTGASRFKDPGNFPWTLSLIPSYAAEGKALARYVLQSVAAPKIAILYQNDDLGKDFAGGFKGGLGEKAKSLIASEQTFEVSDTTIDSAVIAAKASGANVFYFAGTQKFGAMQIRVRFNLGWKPMHLVCSTSSGIESVLRPAGFEAAEGLISTTYAKDPADQAWASDLDTQKYLEWVKTYLPQGNPRDNGTILGYIASFLTAQVLRQAGDDLTRENVLKIATHLDDLEVPMLLPGIKVHTAPIDYSVINQFQVQRFDAGSWTPVGKVISGE